MSTRAMQIDFLLAGAIHPNTGLPLENGKVYAFAAGTGNAATLWLDANKTLEAASPLILNTRGQALVYADGHIKLALYDKDGVYLGTYDNLRYRFDNSSVRTVISSDTVSTDDDLILVDATNGAVTLSLPPAATWVKTLKVKKIDSTANSVILDPYASETIENASTLAVTTKDLVVEIASSGSGLYSTSAGSVSFAVDSHKVDGFHAATQPTANQIPVVNATGNLVLPGKVILPMELALQGKNNLGTPVDLIRVDANNNTVVGPSSNANIYTGTGVKIWHESNDGSASGLDADLLEGFHASAVPAANIIPVGDENGRIPWGAKPAFRGALVYNTGVTTGNITFTSEVYDTDGIHDNTTNPERLTVPSGVTKIKIKAQVRLEVAGSNTVASIFITKNGGFFPGGAKAVAINPTATSQTIYALLETPVITVAAGDFFIIATPNTILSDPSGEQFWFAMEIVE